ncbi:NitT/TauT family transport system permease protein [Stella humosa]|uniref:NitT/TauT family transport system permease protein n=1 Tax=Stella humosa TaxID=94 RepID=A0A3N1MKH0_9PROT|nr:ABC transporter permease [Stella humosa]ROQ03317.1 NitT/TauT family transport system permease protein [Stella humosa]BBK33311.1 ABC transporter permease [Stella humosa]
MSLRLVPWVFAIASLLLWEGLCRLLAVPVFILPPPSAVALSLVKFWQALGWAALYTLATTAAGFALAIVVGAGLGILIGVSRTVYAGLYPVLIGFNSVPKVAIVPVLIIWFGSGAVPAVLTAFLISFFPISVNVATGIATVEPELRDVLRALGARPSDILLKVGIPRALPYFFAALKVAITLAFVGAVVAETAAGSDGVGALMMAASARLDVPLVFAGLFVIAVLGIAMYAVCARAERRFTFWAQRGDVLG